MEQKRDLAIILKTVPYEERHRVVTAITEAHGRVSALARNSIQSRRFGGALEPFAASEWRFVERPGAELFRVEEAQIRRSFEGLRADFEALALASIFNELMLKLAPEREPAPELFRLHSNALAALEELPKPVERAALLALLNGYLSKLMQWSGAQPRLSECLSCQTPVDALAPAQQVSCLVADAGWVCAQCRSQETRHVRGQSVPNSTLRVSATALADFYRGLASPIRQMPALVRASVAEQEGLYRFLEALLEYHVPGFSREAIRGLRFLELDSPRSSGPRL